MSRWPPYRSGLEGIAVVSALGVDIGTLLEEDLDDVEVAFSESGLEGIAVYPALGVDIGHPLEEDLDDVEVASHRSGLEGIAVASALGIDIGTLSRGGSGRCRGGLCTEAAWRALP